MNQAITAGNSVGMAADAAALVLMRLSKGKSTISTARVSDTPGHIALAGKTGVARLGACTLTISRRR